MTILQAVILGIIQGLTEFLPVSSSAHLVLLPFFFNWKIPESQVFPFDVLVQVGTLMAVIVYFWADLWAILRAWVLGIIRGKPFADSNSRMGWYLILASIPAGILGILIKPLVEKAFSNPAATGVFLLITAGLLLTAEVLGKRQRTLNELTWVDAVWIGLFQAVSVFPGISRSGSTISGGMFRHFERKSAAGFSFLMSVPIMLAAGLMGGVDLINLPDVANFLSVMLIGFLTAGVVGYLAIQWFLKYLMRNSLKPFAIYCFLLGLLSLIVVAFR